MDFYFTFIGLFYAAIPPIPSFHSRPTVVVYICSGKSDLSVLPPGSILRPNVLSGFSRTGSAQQSIYLRLFDFSALLNVLLSCFLQPVDNHQQHFAYLCSFLVPKVFSTSKKAKIFSQFYKRWKWNGGEKRKEINDFI